MNPSTIAIIAIAVLAFGLISARLQRSVVTPPMVFVLLGLLIGPQFLGLVSLNVEHGFIHILLELTLVLILFTDAARIDLRCLYREHNLPIRLLVVGMPLTLLAGAFTASFLFPAFTFLEAAILAAVLTPTDAALGQVVVENKSVPVRIRQALNVESGLNDGIALPIILILVSFSAMGVGSETAHWIQFTAQQLILGPIVGVLVGYAGGKSIEFVARREWITHTFEDLSTIALSLIAFSVAEVIGGNGFIAAFCAGLTLGNATRSLCTCLYDFAQAEGQLLSLLTFLIFGAVLLPLALHYFSWSVMLYSVLSLTLIRMIPVLISLMGLKLRADSLFYLSWFGPRGIASILFGLIVLEASNIPIKEELMSIVVLTVFISVIVHGVTAYPLSKWYGQRMKTCEPRPEHEHAVVTEMPTRIPH